MSASKTPRPLRSTKPPGLASTDSLPRRAFFPVLAALLAVGVVFVGIGVLRDRGDGTEDVAANADWPTVGGDLHAVAVFENRRFVSGHAGAAYSDGDAGWTPVRGLEGKDGMAWANVAGRTLVGGHEGLYVSNDGGVTFANAQVNLPVTDIHALGGSAETVYLATPQAGLFVSTDAGMTFTHRGDAGRSFMGTILVDPAKPEHAVAPDMAGEVTETLDGGRTWRSLGGPRGAMSVAWDIRNRARLVAAGADGVMLSTDAGQSWQRINAPTTAAVVAFDGQGRLLAATLVGDRAQLHRSADSGATWSAI